MDYIHFKTWEHQGSKILTNIAESDTAELGFKPRSVPQIPMFFYSPMYAPFLFLI